ncbi:MAG: tyrosine-type recombinase/integrase [Terriglobales bacterium]
MTRRRFQRGSIYRRGERKKVWIARYCEDVIGPDGALTRIRRSDVLGAVAEIPTRRQAEQLLAERLRSVNSSEYRPSSACTFRDYVENRWLPEVLPTLKYSSKKHYQYMLRVHLYPAFGEMQLRLITRDAVQLFLSAKLRSGLSWRTVKSLRTAFGTVMAAAEVAELIPSNPIRKTRFPRRGPAKQRAVIAPEKIRDLLDALPEPSRSLGWLLVLTGLRIGELLALRWQNVDLEQGTLRVTQTVYDGHFDVPKTQRSQRSVPLAAKAVQILAARKPAAMNPEALVFATSTGAPFDRHNLTNRQLKSTCKKLNLVGVNWHWLRHVNATLLDAVGTPLGTVQALLGHSSSEITREVYLHSIPADARAAVEKVEELLNRPKLTQVPEAWGKGSSLIQ